MLTVILDIDTLLALLAGARVLRMSICAYTASVRLVEALAGDGPSDCGRA